MKILVCISCVPDTTSKITFTDNDTKFNSNGIQYIINPYDEIALSKAVELTEGDKGQLTTITIGDASTEAVIRKALATGADEAVRIEATPRDAWFVANQIAHFAKEKQFDLILTGRESIDANGSEVGAMVAALLNIPSVSITKKIDVDQQKVVVEREIEGGKEILELPLPVVLGTAEGVAEPKIPNMRGIMSARTKPLAVVEAVDVPVLQKTLKYETPAPRGQVTLIDAGDVEQLVKLLHSEAKVI